MAELLIALDFDGTVAPIQSDPAAVAIDPAIAAFLRRAALTRGVCTAIVSGRDVDDLSARLSGIPAYLAGSHGLEILSPRGTPLREAPPLGVALDDSIERDAAANGIRIERKKHAISLHWREAPAVDDSHPLIDAFRRWATSHQLDLIHGRRVLEARCRGGGKEDALRYLTVATDARRVVYAGDDLTDFAALRFAAARGRAYFVASDERDAPPVAISVASHDELLRNLINELNKVETAA